MNSSLQLTLVLIKTFVNYSGHRLMGSPIMESIGWWDKIILFDKSQITILLLMYIKFIRLLLSIRYWNQFLSVSK
jgi:hypothetical protein